MRLKRFFFIKLILTFVHRMNLSYLKFDQILYYINGNKHVSILNFS